MGRILTKFTCPLCKDSKDVRLQKPKPLQPTVISVTCLGCVTDWMARYSRKSVHTMEISVEAQVVNLGPKFAHIALAQAAKIIEDAKQVEKERLDLAKDRAQQSSEVSV